MRCYCFLRNVVDLIQTAKMSEPKTAYEMRFGSSFRGPVVPFGAAVTYKPSAEKDKERLHKFSAKTLQGIFMGYYQQAGGGWSGDLFIIDIDELEEAEDAADVYIKKLKAEEGFVTKREKGSVRGW